MGSCPEIPISRNRFTILRFEFFGGSRCIQPNGVMNKFSNYIHSAVKCSQVANERTACAALVAIFRIRFYDFKFSSDPFRPISTLVKSTWNSMNAHQLPLWRKNKNWLADHGEFHRNKMCPARKLHVTMDGWLILGARCSDTRARAHRERCGASLWMQMRVKKAATRKLDARDTAACWVISENEIKYC